MTRWNGNGIALHFVTDSRGRTDCGFFLRVHPSLAGRMRIYCACKCNHIDIPDDQKLSPGFTFVCRTCSGSGETQPPVSRHRRQHSGDDESIGIEAFLPRVETIATSFAKTYDLCQEDCTSEGTLAVLQEEERTKKNGKAVSTKDLYAVARRALFRFAERELAERGRVREGDPERPGEKKWAELARVTIMDKKPKNDEAISLREAEARDRRLVEHPSLEQQAIETERKRMVWLAVKELPMLQRKVVFLLFEKGLTVREAAQILKLSKSEVSRISTAATTAIAKKFGTKSRIVPIDTVGKQKTASSIAAPTVQMDEEAA